MIVAFAGQKGGAGKTTAAISVAAELLLRGAKVLLVDADPQGSLRTWAQMANELGRPAPTTVAMGADMFAATQLPRLAPGFDHVFIDCPPRHGEIQRAALMVADVAVLPCGQGTLDAWSMAATLALVTEARAVRPVLAVVALLTRVQPRTVLGQGARDVLAQAGLAVLKTELGFRIAYQEAPATGLGVSTYAPHDPAADEIRALVSELLALAPAASPSKKGRSRRGR